MTTYLVPLSACCGALPGDVCDCAPFAATAAAALANPIVIGRHREGAIDPVDPQHLLPADMDLTARRPHLGAVTR